MIKKSKNSKIYKNIRNKCSRRNKQIQKIRDLARELMEKAKTKGVKLMLPVDTKVGKEFKVDTESKTVKYTEITKILNYAK